MRIGITGASGLLGSALVPHLREHGHAVVRFVRRPAQSAEERSWDPAAGRLEPADLVDLDAVVHLAAAGVGDKRWTRARKAVVLRSRVDGTTTVARAMAAAQGPQVLLSASAIGFYGDTGDRITDETGPSGDGFLAEVVRQWEAATGPAEAAGIRVVRLRSGVVLSGDGGILGRTRLIYQAGLGAPLGSGRQWLSWISLRDEIAAMRHLLTADVSGPVNLVAPAPVTNRTFTKAMGHVLHRPTLPIPVPGFVLRAAIGGFAEEAVLMGQRVEPKVLLDSGFRFDDPDVESALRASL